MSCTIILTRPQHRNASLARLLQDNGWKVLELPALALQAQLPPASEYPLPAAFDAVVFVSSFAARVYLDGLRQLSAPVSWPAHTLAVTVGHASAAPLYAAGFIPHDQIV